MQIRAVFEHKTGLVRVDIIPEQNAEIIAEMGADPVIKGLTVRVHGQEDFLRVPFHTHGGDPRLLHTICGRIGDESIERMEW